MLKKILITVFLIISALCGAWVLTDIMGWFLG